MEHIYVKYSTYVNAFTQIDRLFKISLKMKLKAQKCKLVDILQIL